MPRTSHETNLPRAVEGALVKGFFQRRLLDPLRALLLQGITPRQLALSLAVGAAVGTFPVLGTTTLLCLAIALVLRLNVVAIQLVNWVVYPVQILLLIPFYRMGSLLFATQHPTFSASQLLSRFQDDLGGALRDYGDATLHAAAAWSLTAVPVALVLFVILRPMLGRLLVRPPAEARAS